MGRPLAALRGGGVIETDIPARTLNVRLSEDKLRVRMRDWMLPKEEIPPGFLRFCTRYVGAAHQGAMLGESLPSWKSTLSRFLKPPRSLGPLQRVQSLGVSLSGGKKSS